MDYKSYYNSILIEVKSLYNKLDTPERLAFLRWLKEKDGNRYDFISQEYDHIGLRRSDGKKD